MLIVKNSSNGFTLIEILIALLLGSLLLSMVIGLYVSNVSAGYKALKFSQLRTDLQGLVGLMEGDIRRAGYGGDNLMVGSDGNKVVDTVNTNTIQCIVYAYNYDNATMVSSAHYMGFRYSSNNGSLQFGRHVNKQASECFKSGIWYNLSDPKFLKITSLHFIEDISVYDSLQFRSVDISITGALKEQADYHYQLSTRIKVRNPEYE